MPSGDICPLGVSPNEEDVNGHETVNPSLINGKCILRLGLRRVDLTCGKTYIYRIYI